MSQAAKAVASKEQVLAQWLAAGQRARAQLSAPGVCSPQQLASRNGAAFFAAISSGELPYPPICKLLDFWPVEDEITPGKMVFQGTPTFDAYNPIGSVHGGYIATLLDSAVGCAVHSTLPQGKGYTTLELKVNYLRALTDKTGPVRAIGQVIQAGERVAVAEGKLIDAAGKLYAHATTTCLVFALSE
jgi:uncharacterized protein (TIGR00369 family)